MKNFLVRSLHQRVVILLASASRKLFVILHKSLKKSLKRKIKKYSKEKKAFKIGVRQNDESAEKNR